MERSQKSQSQLERKEEAELVECTFAPKIKKELPESVYPVQSM
jgi:hypothetical protein